MESADVFLGLHDFLERMRKPSAADFVKSIKSFIVSISNNAPDIEKDSAAVQEFFTTMEAAFKAHPLWSGCSEEELDNAGEGLEKYIMTKLFTRVFASNPEESKCDEQLFQKMALVQQFISPENLDIKPAFQNETSWLLAQKELQKINMYKAPRDKLVCILNCCKVINNLLFNAAVASDENAPGADEFLPVLIYVTIKANPPQLHSNLLYIQRYRRQSKLVGEVAYFFTNMLSAESFISNIDAKSISMDEAEFEKNMELSRALLSGLDSQSSQIDQSTAHPAPDEPTVSKTQTLNSKKEKDLRQSQSSDNLSGNKEVTNPNNSIPIKKAESLPDLENKGAALLLKDNQASKVFQDYPYVFATVGDLTISDVEDLLNNYKQLVLKYVCLSKGLSGATTSSEPSIFSPLQVSFSPDTSKEFEDRVSSSDVKLKRDIEERDFGRDIQFEGESVMHKHPDEHASVKIPDAKEGRANPKVNKPENSVADSKFLQADNEENAEVENAKSSLAASSKHSSVADNDEQSEISDDPSK